MKSKKKKFLVYGNICVFVLGVCLFLFFNKQIEKKEETVPMPDNTALETEMETGIESTKLTDILEGSENDTVAKQTEADTDMPDKEKNDTEYVFYMEDEGVRDNPVFAAFIDKEITAYDLETGENRYIYECSEYYDYGFVPSGFGVHYTTEDLDGDGENELLAFLQWNDTDGDLLVFHESEGKVYQWETWGDFFWNRMMEKKYYGNGIFSIAGGAGAIVGRYNAEGKIEYIADYGTWQEQEEGEWITKNSLVVYRAGIEEKKLAWEGPPYWNDELWGEITPENLIIKDECAAIMNEIWGELGEGKLIRNIEWEDKAQKITLHELLNKNKMDKDREHVVFIEPEEQKEIQEESIEDFDALLAGINNSSRYSYVMEGCEEADYGYYDVNHDGVDELVILTVRGITIFMYQDDGIKEICRYSYSVLLGNGMVWYHRPGGAPIHDCYQAFSLEGMEYQLVCVFERYDDDFNGYFDENGEGDIYLYNSEEISKEEWDELIQPYVDCEEAILHDTGIIKKIQ